MKKTVKIMSVLLLVTMLLASVGSVVFADTASSVLQQMNNAQNQSVNGTNEITTLGGRIVGIVQVVGVVIAVIIILVIGIKYMINNFFTILTRNPSSRDTYEVVSIIRTRIREALFESTIDAPIEYTISYTMTPISKIYKQIVELVYMDLASYFFQAEITDLGVFGSIINDVIINYLCNFIMYEYLGLINWVISRSIGCMQNDKFIHRLATYMQHCLINKEVLCNADHS